MAVCPLCNAQIPGDFGLVECPSCSAQLLMHMDGRVEYSGSQDAVGLEPEDAGATFAATSVVPSDATEVAKRSDENFEFGEPFAEIELPPESGEANEPTIVHQDLMGEADFSEQEKLEQEKRFDASFSGEEESPPPPPPVTARNRALSGAHRVQEGALETDFAPSPAAEPEAEFAADPLADPFDIIPEEAAAEVYQPAAARDPSDLSDIASFGNSEASSTRDGSLRYNLIITGIDTADVRESFREAITDRKLVWDIDQILRSLRNGEVRIQNVPPPKAYILITRLRNLPVQVRWEQYAISQT